MALRAVVTAGGTREPIDDVRVLTNLSTGRFGLALARALAARGVQVVLLAGQGVQVEGLDGIEVIRFGSASDLRERLESALAQPTDLVLMAAAVADYAPEPTQGKIRSSHDELVLRMRKVRKILPTLREQAPNAVLVGFKLLSGVTAEELVAVAQKQNARNRLDLTFANDLAELGGATHPGWLVGDAVVRLEGARDRVAAEVVARCLAKTGASRREAGPPPHSPAFERAGVLLRIGRDAGFGVVSGRAEEGLWIGPSEVARTDDLVYTSLVDGVLRYHGDVAPEPAAALHARLYATFPAIEGLVHTTGLVLHHAVAPPAPEAIAAALAQAALAERWTGGGFAVDLGGTSLIGVTDVFGLLAAWTSARAAFEEAHGDAPVAPILDGERVIGVWARPRDPAIEGAVGVWILPEARGQGLGDRVAEALGGQPVVCPDEAAAWWIERGWQVQAQGDGLLWLRPPQDREPPRPAASICLLDPIGRRVLLGRRCTPPWDGWWAFPGGSMEPGESTLQAGLRELREETGISASGPCLQETVVYVGTAETERFYQVTNHVVPCFGAPAPQLTSELEARWVPFDEAVSLRPMAAGTRRVLRKILARSG